MIRRMKQIKNGIEWGEEHDETNLCQEYGCKPVTDTVTVSVPAEGPVLVIDGEVVQPDEMKIGLAASGRTRYAFWVTPEPTFFEVGKTYRYLRAAEDRKRLFEVVRVDGNVAYGKVTFEDGTELWDIRRKFVDWEEEKTS